MNTSSNPDCSNLFYAHLLALRTRSIPRSKSSVNSDFLNSPNLNLSKRIIPIFHSISIYIIKSNITRIYRQDNRKRFIAVNINHLNCVAIIYFKLLHLLLIHRNKSSFIISLYSKLHNSSLNPRKSSTSTEKISEGKSWTIDIDGKRMVTQILRVRNICSHRAGNASIDRPIILNLLRRTNLDLTHFLYYFSFF